MEDSSLAAADAARKALVSLLRSYRVSQVLFLAYQISLFHKLPPQGASADELAQELKVPAPGLRHVLGALAALGILACEGGRYVLRNDFRSLLDPNSAEFIGPILESARGENNHWSHAAREILQGTYAGAPYQGEFLDAATVQQNLRNVEASNRQAISLVWPLIEAYVKTARRVLDLGGGHGAYAMGALLRAPYARARIIDLPEAIEYCRLRHRSGPHADRLELVPGSALELDYEETFDIIFLNDVLVYFNHESKREILARCFRALKNGGRLVMVKISLDSNRDHPQFAAIFSLNMFITSMGGYLETDAEASQMCDEVGFAATEVFKLTSDRSVLLAKR